MDGLTGVSISGFEDRSELVYDIGTVDWETHKSLRLKVHLTSGISLTPVIHGIHLQGRVHHSFNTNPLNEGWTTTGSSWSSGQMSGSGTLESPEWDVRRPISRIKSTIQYSGSGHLEASIDGGAWQTIVSNGITTLDKHAHSAKFKWVSDGGSWTVTDFEIDLTGGGLPDGLRFDLSRDQNPEWSIDESTIGPWGWQNRFSNGMMTQSLDLTSTDKTETSGYKSDKRGFNLGTTFEQYEGIFLSPSLEILHENIETDSTASEQLKKQDGNYFNTDFTYGVTLDKRNLTFNPTDGYQVSFFQSIPLVQDKSSLRNAFYASGYNEVSENVITSLKGEVKTIHGIDDDVRLSERMYVSQRKLRGFANGKVGPKDGTDWVGGNYVTSLSAEAQLPNLLPEAYKTDFSVFLDTANVWGVDYNSSLDDSNKIRSSIGLAANLFTPVGPLSWTLSQAITKTSTDETEMFNFNLGTSF